jgi:hypothetical protein
MMKILRSYFMNNITYRIATILFCLGLYSCNSDGNRDLIKNNDLIKNWNSYPMPSNADTLRKYDYSPKEWTVFIKNDQVHVTTALATNDQLKLPINIEQEADSKTKISFLSVDDGYLIGFYRGEWGGHLKWFSKDGKHNYLISDDEIVQFIKRDGKNYAIQGLAHMTISEGSIINIEKNNGKWGAKEYLKLPTAPDAIAIDRNNNFIIITSKSLLKVGTDSKIVTLKEKGIWYNQLYTNSMVIKDDVIYAGMRAGVYKYNLLNNKEAWLLPY